MIRDVCSAVGTAGPFLIAKVKKGRDELDELCI